RFMIFKFPVIRTNQSIFGFNTFSRFFRLGSTQIMKADSFPRRFDVRRDNMNMRMPCILMQINQVRLIAKTNLIQILVGNLYQLCFVYFLTDRKVQRDMYRIRFRSFIAHGEVIKTLNLFIEIQLLDILMKTALPN